MFSVTKSDLSTVTKRACEDNYLFEPQPGNLRIAIVGGWLFMVVLQNSLLLGRQSSQWSTLSSALLLS